jgi:hypothetical protein
MKCLCRFEKTAEKRFMSFRAVVVHHISGMYSEYNYPNDAVKLYVCPECGTVKVKLGKHEQEMKQVRRDHIVWAKGFSGKDWP